MLLEALECINFLMWYLTMYVEDNKGGRGIYMRNNYAQVDVACFLVSVFYYPSLTTYHSCVCVCSLNTLCTLTHVLSVTLLSQM